MKRVGQVVLVLLVPVDLLAHLDLLAKLEHQAHLALKVRLEIEVSEVDLAHKVEKEVQDLLVEWDLQDLLGQPMREEAQVEVVQLDLLALQDLGGLLELKVNRVLQEELDFQDFKVITTFILGTCHLENEKYPDSISQN